MIRAKGNPLLWASIVVYITTLCAAAVLVILGLVGHNREHFCLGLLLFVAWIWLGLLLQIAAQRAMPLTHARVVPWLTECMMRIVICAPVLLAAREFDRDGWFLRTCTVPFATGSGEEVEVEFGPPAVKTDFDISIAPITVSTGSIPWCTVLSREPAYDASSTTTKGVWRQTGPFGTKYTPGTFTSHSDARNARFKCKLVASDQLFVSPVKFTVLAEGRKSEFELRLRPRSFFTEHQFLVGMPIVCGLGIAALLTLIINALLAEAVIPSLRNKA